MKIAVPRYLLVLLVFSQCLVAQKRLDISYTRFNKLKVYSVHNYDLLHYKTKGKICYTTNKVVYMNDSLLLFADGKKVRLDQIKKIKLDKPFHVLRGFQHFFFGLGIGFLPLNTLNNVITDTRPVYSELATIVTAGLLTTSYIFKELQIKRITITKNKVLKVVEFNYQELNKKSD